MAIYENWTEDHGSPSIATDQTGHVLTLRYWALWENVWIGLPEIGSSYPGSLTKYYDTKLTNYTLVNRQGGEYATITLIYKSDQKGGGAYPEERKDSATIYTMTDGMLEKPIESKTGYLMIWNHSLAQKKTGAAATPEGYLTATSDTLDADGWQWVKDISDVGSEWKIFYAGKTLKGAESYPISSPVVTKRSYYTRQSSANSAASTSGTKQTPGNEFGKTDGEWLVISTNVYFEDGFWVAEIQYQFADEWLDELYD